MKKLLSFFALLFVALGVSAQSWTPVPSSQYNHETIVYADLTTNIANATLSDFKVAAFVGDECRAEGVVTYNQQTMDAFLVFNVRGDLTADQGKEITFKAYHKTTEAEYELTSSPVVMFDGESHISPSNRIQLTLTAATSITINYIQLAPGETVNLLDYVEVQPEGAVLPTNHTWSLEDNPIGTISGDQLTAGSETGSGPISLQVGDDTYYCSFSIRIPATAITANVQTVTVKVGAWIELNGENKLRINENNVQRYIENFYTLTPADATDQVYFNQAADQTILVDAQGSMRALKAGTTTVTLCTRDNQWNVALQSAPITFIVEQPVTEIQFSEQSITTSVPMTSLASRLASMITVLPEDATDKTFTLTAADPTILDVTNFDDGEYTVRALKAGNTTLTATARDGSGVTATITVYVEDPATKATFANDPLIVTLTSTDEPTDISQQILGNITTNGSLMWTNGEITVSTGGPVSGEGMISGNGPFGAFTAQSEGTSTVYVALTYNNWDAYTGEGDVPQTTLTYSFEVQVLVEIPLTGFQVEFTYQYNGDGTIDLTPVPENATFNPSDIQVNITAVETSVPDSWQPTYSLTSGSNTPLTYSLHTYVPGMYTVTVSPVESQQGDTYTTEYIQVPADLSFASGWQWRSNPYGIINSQNVEQIFQQTKFYEARTQEDLLINDPEWGYFGTLLSVGIPQAACYKLKMNEATTQKSMLWNGSISGDPLNADLQNGWTWVGSPYFYDRLLSNAIPLDENDLPDGTVIISKSGGSAEVENGQWQGDLTVFKAGEGYIVYNPEDDNTLYFAKEFSMQPANEGASAPVKGQFREESIWQYDASQFMNNMTMVAELPEINNPENYSIGAFIGGECRGEGTIIDGKAFITIHTDGGEEVSLRLYNELLGEYFDIDETFPTQTRLGSLKAPVQLHSTAVVTSINGVNANGSATESYDLSGRRINGQQRGINIQRMTDGTVRKVLVK